ncbi:MAG: hypothetical protein LBI64_07590 [Coriobacteriales bacterium]|jgi:cell filamentation protein|nr:hypothetical protein [Coriobacteriales bacterium]
MESRRKRYINFDLDSAALRNALGGENGRKRAYSHIKKYMTGCGFEHRQGSAYMSGKALTDAEVFDLTDGIVKKHPWLAACTNGYDVTNVGATHDYLYVFKKRIASKRSAIDDDLSAIDDDLFV